MHWFIWFLMPVFQFVGRDTCWKESERWLLSPTFGAGLLALSLGKSHSFSCGLCATIGQSHTPSAYSRGHLKALLQNAADSWRLLCYANWHSGKAQSAKELKTQNGFSTNEGWKLADKYAPLHHPSMELWCLRGPPVGLSPSSLSGNLFISASFTEFPPFFASFLHSHHCDSWDYLPNKLFASKSWSQGPLFGEPKLRQLGCFNWAKSGIPMTGF